MKADEDNRIAVNLTTRQILDCEHLLLGHLRQRIIECNYVFAPGDIAGLASDIRALRFLRGTDASDAGIVVPVKLDPDARKKEQAAERKADTTERRKLGAA